MSTVADRLVALHGQPTLGNYRDPVKEIFYIMLSARTTEPLYKTAHRRLFARYPDVRSLAKADVETVAKYIDRAGLGRKRAAHVVATARKLVKDFGRRPQSAIRRMSSSECFKYLTSLSGLGPKSSLCVMMYSHDSDVFPVDINVQRIAESHGCDSQGAQALPGPGATSGLRPIRSRQGTPRCNGRARSKDMPAASPEMLRVPNCRYVPHRPASYFGQDKWSW